MKVELLEEIQPMIVGSVNAQAKHLETSPETKKLIRAMKDNCTKCTNEFNLKQKMIQNDIETIKDFIAEDKEWKKELEERFVSKKEFEPVKGVVYGLIVVVMTSFVGGLIALIWKA